MRKYSIQHITIRDIAGGSRRTTTFDKGDLRIQRALEKQLGRSATREELREARIYINEDIRINNLNRVKESFNRKISLFDKAGSSDTKGVILNVLGAGDSKNENGLTAREAKKILKDIENLGDEKTQRKINRRFNKQNRDLEKAGKENLGQVREDASLETMLQVAEEDYGDSLTGSYGAEHVVDLRTAKALVNELKTGLVTEQRLRVIIEELETIVSEGVTADWIVDSLQAAKVMLKSGDYSTDRFNESYLDGTAASDREADIKERKKQMFSEEELAKYGW